MLFDIGWPELMLIGVVALVVIGPKDLPRALRIAGYWVRKARTLSREFQSSVEQMIREAELDDMRQELKKATEFDIEKEFHTAIDPDGSLAEAVKPPEIPDYFEDKPAAPEAVGSVGAEPELPIAAPHTEPALPIAADGVPEPAAAEPTRDSEPELPFAPSQP
jgi:sec-independent protein translocase protein TatB